MIILNGTLELYCLFLNPLCLPVKGSELNTFPYVENSQCGPQLSYIGRAPTAI